MDLILFLIGLLAFGGKRHSQSPTKNTVAAASQKARDAAHGELFSTAAHSHTNSAHRRRPAVLPPPPVFRRHTDLLLALGDQPDPDNPDSEPWKLGPPAVWPCLLLRRFSTQSRTFKILGQSLACHPNPIKDTSLNSP